MQPEHPPRRAEGRMGAYDLVPPRPPETPPAPPGSMRREPTTSEMKRIGSRRPASERRGIDLSTPERTRPGDLTSLTETGPVPGSARTSSPRASSKTERRSPRSAPGDRPSRDTGPGGRSVPGADSPRWDPPTEKPPRPPSGRAAIKADQASSRRSRDRDLDLDDDLDSGSDEGVWAATPVKRGGSHDAKSQFAAGRSSTPPSAVPSGDGPLPPPAFDSFGDEDDDLGRATTQALLAARAEPLDDPASGRRPGKGSKGGKRPSGKSGRPSAPPRGAQAARAEAARVNRGKNRRQPKEPSKALLVLAVIAIIGAGFGAAWWLTGRDNSDGSTEANQALTDGATDTSADAGTDGAATDAAADAADGTDEAAGNASPSSTLAPVDLSPVVVFDEAAFGPVNADAEYTIAVGDAPAEAMYQLLVDGTPAAEAAPQLGPVTFTAGRHLMVVEMTTPDGMNFTTDPVLVYAVAAEPPTTFGANLASVNTDPDVEGWAEALRKFDDYVAAGHTDLQLVPSEQYPTLPEGYWVLFVGGFSDTTTAEAYCEEKGIAVPDECFGREFDPTATAS